MARVADAQQYAMAPNAWNTSSPAAGDVSIFSSRLSSAMPRFFSIVTLQHRHERRGDANCPGCAVQFALLRHSGTALAHLDQPASALVTPRKRWRFAWMAGHLEAPVTAFAEYARRPQTMTDHARQLTAALGPRPPTLADVPPMIVLQTPEPTGQRQEAASVRVFSGS